MIRLFFTFIILYVFDFSFGGEVFLERHYINGVKFIIKQTKGPGIVSGTIFIKGGSIDDPPGKKGLVNLTLKLLLKGSKNYDAFYINKFFEDSGGFISSSVSEEVSTIEFSVREEDFPKSVDIIKDILSNPAFPQDKLEIEINNAKSQIKARKEDGFLYGLDKLRTEVFKGTPFETSPLGKEEDLDNITILDIKQMWQNLFSSEKILFSIVGDIDTQIIKKSFSDINIPLAKPQKEFKVDLKLSKEECKVYNREGAQSTILLLYEAPGLDTEDYFKFRVLNTILGNGFTSKLFQELREKKGYAYAVGSSYSPRFKFGTMIAYIGTAPEKTEDAINDMKNIIYQFPNLISEEDLYIAKEKIIGDFLMNHQTRLKQSYYLGWFEMVGFGFEYDEKFPQLIKSIELKDVVEVYKKYLQKGNFCVVVKP